MKPLSPRGMTLVELTVALAILTVVVAMTMQVIVVGVNLARNGNETADSNESARIVGDTLALQARLAGMGAATGFNVAVAGTTRTISPIIGVNSTTGPDELWVVTPSRTTFNAGCDGTNAGDPNAAAVVQESRTDGVLKLRCSNTLPANGVFMVTNLTSAALIEVTGYTSGGTQVTYAESSVPGFTNNYKRGGFSAGDLVVPVNILHYYINPTFGPNAEPTLMVARGTINTAAGGLPFVEVANSAQAVLGPIEDMQFQFGVDPTDSDDPGQIVWQNGFGGAQGTWTPGLRSVTVSLVSRSRLTMRDTTGSRNLGNMKPLSVADHVLAAPVSDGFRRVRYERRIELPNAAPWNL